MDISFTDAARSKIREYMEMAENGCIGLRLAAHRQGRSRLRHDFSLVLDGETTDDDLALDCGGFTLYVDPQSAELLDGTSVDFVSDFSGSGFKIDNPNARVQWDDPVAREVQSVLDEKVTPAVASHGGWVELLAVEDDAAIIEFGGGCQGCGMSQVTLKQGIEAAILDHVPAIKRVLDATDHASGANPYY